MPRREYDLMTAEEVAEYAGVSQRTIWRWLAAGLIPRPLNEPERVRLWRREQIEKSLSDSKP